MTYKTLNIVHKLLVENVKDANRTYDWCKKRLADEDEWEWVTLTRKAFDHLQEARVALEDFKHTQF